MANWSAANTVSRDHRIQLLLSDLMHTRRVVPSRIGATLCGKPWQYRALVADLSRRSPRQRIGRAAAGASSPPSRFLLEATGEDSDPLVHDVLIRFCAAFTDQGFAHWALPTGEAGFFRRSADVIGNRPAHRSVAAGFPAELSAGRSPRDRGRWNRSSNRWNCWASPRTIGTISVRDDAGVAWLGQHDLAKRSPCDADRVPFPVPPGSVVEFLAIRLILDRLALGRHRPRRRSASAVRCQGLRSVAQGSTSPGTAGPVSSNAPFWCSSWPKCWDGSRRQLFHLSKRSQWSTLAGRDRVVRRFGAAAVFHLAFERRFRMQTLDALIVVHPSTTAARGPVAALQAVFCIDTREESFRRHLEEFSPRGRDVRSGRISFAWRFIIAAWPMPITPALCPIVIKPQHWIIEEVVYPLEESNRAGPSTRRDRHRFASVPRSQPRYRRRRFVRAGLGVLASVPLVARVMFPRAMARIRPHAGQFVQPPPITRLRLERIAAEPGPEEEGIGFSLDEMGNLGERVLCEIGLTTGFSRLVMLLGHGSFCLNNPHKSAYDCGACSGNAGRPNARALAAMLNDPRVRDVYAERGLAIPSETWFLGGLHKTCDDRSLSSISICCP